MNWKSGDVVALKSGGPTMTVDWVDTQVGVTTVYCVWFDNKELKKEGFQPAALKAASPE